MGLLRLNENRRLKSATSAEEIRPSLQDVLLLVDTSGSMAGDKITQAKQGAVDFARSANRYGCTTALAVFGSRAAMVCDLTVETTMFERKITNLQPGIVGGSTNLAAGLDLARKFPHLNAVVVITDGQPDSQRAALSSAEKLKKAGVDILCIGTDDADRSFLARLATRSDLALHVESRNLRASIGGASQLLLGSAR